MSQSIHPLSIHTRFLTFHRDNGSPGSTQTIWYSMAVLPTGFLTHLYPLRGCRKECKYTLNLSRQAAPCSLANGFPICRSHTIQRLIKPTMEKQHSEEPNCPFHIRCLLLTT